MKLVFYKILFLLVFSSSAYSMTCKDVFPVRQLEEVSGRETKERDRWLYAGNTRSGVINLWGTFVCSSCKSQTFALPNRNTNAQHCQNCGKPHQKESFRPPKVMSEGSKLYFLEGTGHAGREDLVKKSLVACPYCRSSTFEDTNYCGGCGASIKGEPVNRLVEDVGRAKLVEVPQMLKPAEVASRYTQIVQNSTNVNRTDSQVLRKGLLALSVVGGSLAVVASIQGYHWYTDPIAVRAQVVGSASHEITLKLNQNDVSGSLYMDLGGDTIKPGDTQWRIGEKVTVYFTRKDGAQFVERSNGDLLTPVIVVRP